MKSSKSSQKGVMLLEALIGILIFSIGILALIAMQSTAVSQVRDSQFRTEASVLADKMMGNLVLITSSNPVVSPGTEISNWQSEVASTLPNGSGSVTLTPSALSAAGSTVTNVNITVNWQAPGATSASNHIVLGTLAYNASIN